MTATTETPTFKPKKSVALSGVAAGNTALCTVGRTGNDLSYRGYDILDLAQKCEFEEVAYLLIHGHLPNKSELAAYKTKLKSMRGLPIRVIKVLESLPAHTHPMDVMRTGVSMLGCVHPERESHPDSEARDIADKLIASLGSILLYWYQYSHNGKRIDVDKLTKEEVASWKTGDVLLLNGKILTGRDAAHKRLVDMLDKGEELPVDFTNRLIYYVGPVDPVGDEVVGPAGPTTATRMDKFTRQMLEQTGLLGMIGKSERGAATCEAIADNKAVYLMAVGGAAYLVAKAIKSSKVLAFPELGMEAVYEFEVKDMPVTVAVDSKGESIHATAPRKWQAKIGIIPVES